MNWRVMFLRDGIYMCFKSLAEAKEYFNALRNANIECKIFYTGDDLYEASLC